VCAHSTIFEYSLIHGPVPSHALQHLNTQLLSFCPRARLSAAAALQHAWFADAAARLPEERKATAREMPALCDMSVQEQQADALPTTMCVDEEVERGKGGGGQQQQQQQQQQEEEASRDAVGELPRDEQLWRYYAEAAEAAGLRQQLAHEAGEATYASNARTASNASHVVLASSGGGPAAGGAEEAGGGERKPLVAPQAIH
jgi:hypothetical protein